MTKIDATRDIITQIEASTFKNRSNLTVAAIWLIIKLKMFCTLKNVRRSERSACITSFELISFSFMKPRPNPNESTDTELNGFDDNKFIQSRK